MMVLVPMLTQKVCLREGKWRGGGGRVVEVGQEQRRTA